MHRCPLKSSQSAAAWAKSNGAQLLLGGAALISLPAQGLELGVPQMLSGLGQPLSMQLPIRWAPGEARTGRCMAVSVEAGEHRLSEAELQQSLIKGADASSALIWLRSKRAMDEPVLLLSVGCPAQQVMALVDPVHAMQAPASGVNGLADASELLEPQPKEASPPLRPAKFRVQRPLARNQLRLSSDSLPPLALVDAEIPGLRWRFDSDLGDTALRGQPPLKAAKEPVFYVRPGAPGASLLMAIDVGRPAGPADLLMAQDGPDRLARAQAQFAALQADHRALKLELEKLSADMAARDAAAAADTQRWLMALAGVMVALAAAGVFFFKRRREASARVAP